MRKRKPIFLLALVWVGIAATRLVPSDSALEVSASVSGRFVNLMTGETREVTLQPELLWVTADELPTAAEALRPLLMRQIDFTKSVRVLPVS
jgi:hypothetical protein